MTARWRRLWRWWAGRADGAPARDSRPVDEDHRLVLDAAGLGTWAYDFRTETLTWDAHSKAFLGLPPDAPVNAEMFFSRVHPDDREALHAARRAALDPEGRGEFTAEYRVISFADGAPRWLASFGRAFFDPATRRCTRFIGVAFDITGRKRAEGERERAEAALRGLNEELEQRVAQAVAERLKAEANLHQAQKIEAIGLLTGGVAHDFNNLLTAILGNLELVEMRLADDRLRRPVEAAIRSAERGARLIEQLLAFSRRQHLTPRPVDLNAAVAGMSEMLKRTLGGTIDIRTELAPDAWAALIDPTQLELALLNLAINARDAMPLGGTLVIETRNVGAGAPGRPDDVGPGDYVTVAVSDTGEGMTDEVLTHAFEPFFTTKEVGKGSGLGLSQVYGLVKQSGGSVILTSQRGRGTTVGLFLPRALASGGAGMPAAADAAARRGRGRVLVVDDQDDVRDVAVAYLETLGYDTAAAASGRAALALIEGGLAVDLAVVDYAMPGMTGLELMRALESLRPGLPVVIATGYADFTPDDARLAGLRLLKKPFRLQALAAALDDAARRAAERAPNVLPLRPRRS